MNQNSKLYTNTNIRNTFFFEISIGISGNSVLLLFHVLMLCTGTCWLSCAGTRSRSGIFTAPAFLRKHLQSKGPPGPSCCS
ncbi:Vmn1r41 [Phodopus roborovskii]|uniref:Vomeronasal type-1 receptor n=1 Tax=Phodopus roborovskii TaxID=109678 RepID=A0AAV0A559_PHORO|nr:Vmn1r41 [Phodopus roborovskii]